MIQLLNYTAELEDVNANVATQTTAPFDVALGEEKRLVITYEFDKIVDNWSFNFVPALFLSSQDDFSTTNSLPSASFNFTVLDTLPPSTDENAIFSGPNTQQNYSMTYQVSVDRMSLVVKLQFYVTADIKDWLRNIDLDNTSRLLRNSFDSPGLLDNSGDSVFGSIKFIGTYLYVSFQFDNLGNYLYESDGTTATITRNDSGSFLADGLAVTTGGVNAYVYDGAAFVDIATNANITAVTHTIVTFQAGSGTIIPNTSGSQNAYFFSVDNGSNISQGGTTTPTLVTTGVDAFNNFTQIEGDFYDEGFGVNMAFLLERGSDVVTDLSSELDTDVTISLDNNAPISAARYWLIRTDNIQNNQDFFNDYSGVWEDAGPITVNVDTYSASFVIPASIIEIGNLYRIIAVWYNSSNNITSSYISDEILVKDTPETLAVPNFSSEITNYAANLSTDAAINITPYERFKLSVDVDKVAYNSSNVQGGAFDENLTFIKLSFEDSTIIVNNVNGIFKGSPELIIFNDTNNLLVEIELRVRAEWENQLIEFLWEFGFVTVPDTIRYRQRLSVKSFDNIQAVFDSIRLKRASDDVIISNFRGYDEENVKVEVVEAAGLAINTNNVIGFLEESSVQEEDLSSGQLPQLDSDSISNLLGFTGTGTGSFLVKLNELTENSIVAYNILNEDFSVPSFQFVTNWNETNGNFTGILTTSDLSNATWIFENGTTFIGNNINGVGFGLDGTAQTVTVQVSDLNLIESLELNNSGVVGNIDLSQINLNGDLILQSNPDLTSITHSNSNTVGIYRVSNSNLTGNLDLTGVTLMGDFVANGNSNLTTITHSTGSNVVQLYQVQDCNLTGVLDVSNVSATFIFNASNNSLLTGINHFDPFNVGSYTASSCNLTGSIDLSFVTITGGNFNLSNNSNLTSITHSTASNVAQIYFVQNCNLIGSLDISNVQVTFLFNSSSNPLLTNINHSPSNNIASYVASSCDLTGNLDLTGVNLSGVFNCGSSPNLTSIQHSANVQNVGSYFASNCSINTITLGGINLDSSPTFNVANNSMNQSEVDQLLSDLDGPTVTNSGNAIITISGNASPTGGVANPNIISLISKGYSITL